MLGEVRKHKSNGLYYIFEFHPDTERRAWLRLDTFIWGKWREYPRRTTTATNLNSLPIHIQKNVIRKYRRSERSIEGNLRHRRSASTTRSKRKPRSKRKNTASRQSKRQTPSRRKSTRECKSYSYTRCPRNGCSRVRASRTRRAHCRNVR